MEKSKSISQCFNKKTDDHLGGNIAYKCKFQTPIYTNPIIKSDLLMLLFVNPYPFCKVVKIYFVDFKALFSIIN